MEHAKKLRIKEELNSGLASQIKIMENKKSTEKIEKLQEQLLAAVNMSKMKEAAKKEQQIKQVVVLYRRRRTIILNFIS